MHHLLQLALADNLRSVQVESLEEVLVLLAIPQSAQPYSTASAVATTASTASLVDHPSDQRCTLSRPLGKHSCVAEV